MKKIYTVVFALAVMLSMTLSAAALQSKTIYRQQGNSGIAEWFETAADGSSVDKYLSVTKSDAGTDIYLSICTSDATGSYTCKSGYKFTQDDVFDVSLKLESAALSEVQVDLYDWNTGSIETVTIQAKWTGTGDLMKGSYKSMSKFGDFMSKYSETSSSREAIATGSINGNELEKSNFGGLVEFKSASMSMQK